MNGMARYWIAVRRPGVDRGQARARYLIVIIWLLVFLGSIRYVSAQEQIGELTGTVRDASQAALPSVTVTASNDEAKWAVVANTGPDGTYRIRSLEPGHYAVRFARYGLQRSKYQTCTSHWVKHCRLLPYCASAR